MKYYDVVEVRIAVLKHLDKIKDSAPEATVQSFLFDNL